MRARRLSALLLVACLLAMGPASAKGGTTVIGTVVAPVTRTGGGPSTVPVAPVEGVQVILQTADGKASYQSTTNAAGYFQFDNVAEGDYQLVAQRPGIGMAIKPVHVVGPQQMTVEVWLTPSGGQQQAVKPDQIFVAFAGAQQSAPQNSTASTLPMANNPQATRAAIAQGADPFVIGGNVVLPSVNSPNLQYATAITANPNSVMILDPDNPDKIQYQNASGRPFWLCLNAPGTKLFVSTDKQTIDIYDATRRDVMLGSLNSGGIVTDMQLSPDGNWIFASLMASTPGVLVIDPRTNQAARFIPVPKLSNGEKGNPMALAVNADSTRVYVCLSAAGSGPAATRPGEVAVIDTTTMQPLGRGKVGPQPFGAGISPDGRLLFVANNGNATVSVLDTSTMTQIGIVHVGISPTRVAVRPDGTKVYVTCKGSDNVYVITNASGGAALIPVGHNPMGIAITSDGRRVFVANNGSGTVSIIDGNRDVAEKTTTALPNSQPFGVTCNR